MAIETSPSPEHLWEQAIKIIKSEVSFQNFNTWFRSSAGVELNEETFKISVPNKFTAEWLMSKFNSTVSSAVADCLGSERKIEYLIGDREEPPAATTEPPVIKVKNDYSDNIYPDTSLNDRYTLGNYIVGDSNRFAHAAAVAVAEAPMQTRYNPLYIYGGVGLGKTHLVQAIGNYVRENFSTLRILYVTSEKFTNDFIDAITRQKTSEFAKTYRSVDLLLLDDIQFLTGKEATQEQFFHTFNTLYQAGKQIVLTSDRSPREIKGLEERLLSRFQCGLVTDIQPPDLETRIAILNKIVKSENLSIPPDVIAFIANNITKNIRELEGSIIRILASGSLTRKEINLNMAYEVLKDAIAVGKKISVGYIARTVSQYYKIEHEQIKSKRKTADIVRARQIAMYLSRKHTTGSLKSIGEEFGGRDHSTVIHAITTVENFLEMDFSLRSDIDNIEALLKA